MANLAKYTSTMVRRWLWVPPDLAKQTSLCPNLPTASPKADAFSRRHLDRGGIGRGPKRPAAASLLAFWRFCAAACGGGGDGGVSGRLVEKNRGEMEKWWRNMGRKWEFDVCFFWILISMVEPGRKRAFLLMGIWWGYYMEFHGGTHQAKKWQDEIRTSLICINDLQWKIQPAVRSGASGVWKITRPCFGECRVKRWHPWKVRPKCYQLINPIHFGKKSRINPLFSK